MRRRYIHCRLVQGAAIAFEQEPHSRFVAPHEEPHELFIELELGPEGISWILLPVITECIETAQDQKGRHRWMWTAAFDRVPIIKLGCHVVQALGRPTHPSRLCRSCRLSWTTHIKAISEIRCDGHDWILFGMSLRNALEDLKHAGLRHSSRSRNASDRQDSVPRRRFVSIH